MIVAVQPERGHVALSMKVRDTNQVDELFDASKVGELMSRPPSTGSVDFLDGKGSGSEELHHVSRDASSRACTTRAGLCALGRSGAGCLLGCLMLVGRRSTKCQSVRSTHCSYHHGAMSSWRLQRPGQLYTAQAYL